jgi:hypothetical protein
VVIKASAAGEIRSLIAALSGSDDAPREAAIARLAIMGARAVDRLVAAYATAGSEARVAILRALEPSADPRTLKVACDALWKAPDLAVAGAAALRPLVTSTDERIAQASFDALVSTALDHDREQRVRLAALEALQDLPRDVRAPVERAVRADTQTHRPVLLDGEPPSDPAALAAAVAEQAPAAALSVLQKLVDAVREKEQRTPDLDTAREWRSVRGAIHQALANRNSRVALYDLRETIAEASEPLPVSFLAAVQEIGDASCLEPLAAAAARAASGDAWWRDHLQDAMHAIVKRERITRRHAVMRRIAARWPDALQ